MQMARPLPLVIGLKLSDIDIVNTGLPFWLVLVWVCSVAAPKAPASDVSAYLVQKGIDMLQTNSSLSSPATNNGFVFQAFVDSSVTNVLSGATVLPPGGLAKTLLKQPDNQQFKYRKEYDSLKKLNTGAQDGGYVFTITTVHDGTKQLSLPLQGGLYPQTPHLINYDAAQNVDAGGFFDLRWEYIADGIVPDFVQLRIEDAQAQKVFETGDAGRSALDGGDNSLLLTPGTLLANQTYFGTLLASKTVAEDTNSYPGAAGTASYYKRLKFNIKTAPAESAADVRIYSLLKTELFQQTDTNAPVALDNNGFLFQAQVEASISNRVTSITLIFPNGTATNINTSADPKRFELDAKLDRLDSLNAVYPAGTYGFNINGQTQGAKSVSVQLSGDSYPSIPQFQNVEAFQTIDAKQNYIIQWKPFTGATSSDFIHLQVEDMAGNKVFETADLGKSGALTGIKTAAKIPDGTLIPGTAYAAKLLFVRVLGLDTTSYPGALGFAGFGRETHVDIHTLGPPAAAPQLTARRFAPGQGFQFLINGTQGQNYRLEGSPDFHNWVTLGTVTLTASQGQFTDTNSSGLGSRYYRAVQP